MEKDTYSFSQGPKMAVHFVTDSEEGFRVRLVRNEIFCISFLAKLPKNLSDEILTWLSAYSKGQVLPLFKFPRQNLPTFSQAVIDTMVNIPFGKTLSYGEIAHLSGSPGASRAVGSICRTNLFPLFIPCHRVLPKTGGIGNYAFGLAMKEALLKFEGAL